MKSYLPVREFANRMRRTWKPWLILAVILGVCTLTITALFQSGYNSVQAVVNFSYEGIESGINPMGGRFDPDEMKQAEVITAAAAALDMELSEEQVSRIQDAITITGTLPRGTVSRITQYTSRYEDDELNNTNEVRSKTYYPTRYEISLNYVEAGLTAARAADFMNALLESYHTFFVAYYGYNSAFEQALREFDYSAYDYEDSVDVLRNNLQGLEDYLQWLSRLNSTRFVSTSSGLSFDDLVDAIGTLKAQNLPQISSFVYMNHLTKDMTEQLFFYQFRIEALERELNSQNRRLAVLNQQIDRYVKDSALVMSGGSNGESPLFTISQPSEMYNQLITNRVECEADIARNNESIAYYQRRIEEMSAPAITAGSTQKLKSLQEQFSILDEQINAVLDKTRETAREYFETVSLENAFTVVSAPVQKSVLARIVRGSLRPGAGICAILLGGYTLASACGVFLERKKAAADGTAENPEPVGN